MSEKSCPKSVPGLTNMPKNTKMVSAPVTFTLLYGIQTVFNIKSKWSIGFECPHPVIFSPFRILTICLIYKCYGNISKKTTMILAFKMFKQTFLHTCFIPCIFPIIASVIVPSKWEFISGFPYILLTTTLACEKIDQKLLSQLSLRFILKLSPVVVLVNVSVS